MCLFWGLNLHAARVEAVLAGDGLPESRVSMVIFDTVGGERILFNIVLGEKRTRRRNRLGCPVNKC